MHKVLGLIPSPHHINQPWWNMAEILILGRRRQEDQEFRVILTSTGGLRPA